MMTMKTKTMVRTIVETCLRIVEIPTMEKATRLHQEGHKVARTESREDHGQDGMHDPWLTGRGRVGNSTMTFLRAMIVAQIIHMAVLPVTKTGPRVRSSIMALTLLPVARALLVEMRDSMARMVVAIHDKLRQGSKGSTGRGTKAMVRTCIAERKGKPKRRMRLVPMCMTCSMIIRSNMFATKAEETPYWRVNMIKTGHMLLQGMDAA